MHVPVMLFSFLPLSSSVASPMNWPFSWIDKNQLFLLALCFCFSSASFNQVQLQHDSLLYWNTSWKKVTSSSVVPAIAVLVNSGRATEIVSIGLYKFCEYIQRQSWISCSLCYIDICGRDIIGLKYYVKSLLYMQEVWEKKPILFKTKYL